MQATQSLSPMYASLPSPALPATIRETTSPRPRNVSTTIALTLVLACVAGSVFDLAARSPRPHHDRIEVVSGRAGLKKAKSGQDVRWAVDALTVTLDPSLLQVVPGAKDAIVAAFGTWMSSSAGVPSVTVDTTTTAGGVAMDGVNRLLVGKITNPGYEHAIALTTSYYDDSGDLLEADTVFNSEYVFGTFAAQGQGCNDAYDLQDIATHEAGHIFGLGEDYDDTSTTMYVSSDLCEMHKRELTSVDVSVMKGLYAGGYAPAASRAGCGGGTAVGR